MAYAGIVTVTPNPALDRASSASSVSAGPKLRCLPPRVDPGGGGINVARVVRLLGGEATAVTALGGRTGDHLADLLRAAGLSLRAVPIAGETRDSLTIDDRDAAEQYRFVFPGPPLAESEQEALLAAAADETGEGTWVVGSGSLPDGCAPSFWADLATVVSDRGGRFVLDTSGESARLAFGRGLAVLRCNKGEMEALVGQPLDDDSAQEEAVGALRAAGAAETIVMGLAEKGSMVVHAGGVERIPSPALPKRSAVGAGDSLVGGLTFGLASGWAVADAAALGVICASAAHATPGTELCRRDDVARLFEEYTGRSLD